MNFIQLELASLIVLHKLREANHIGKTQNQSTVSKLLLTRQISLG